MKKIIAIVFGMLVTLSLNAQLSEERYQELKTLTDTSSVSAAYKQILGKADVINAIRSRLNNLDNIISPPRFKIYKTQNKAVFLELDTQFGRLYRIQWSDNSKKTDKRKRPIGDVTNLSEPWENHYPGRYDLYETASAQSFILIDSYTGNTWQVKWEADNDDDIIEPIKY